MKIPGVDSKMKLFLLLVLSVRSRKLVAVRSAVLGKPVVPLFPFYLRVSLSKIEISRKRGTL